MTWYAYMLRSGGFGVLSAVDVQRGAAACTALDAVLLTDHPTRAAAIAYVATRAGSCDVCAGLGYLLEQTYGFADPPDGWTFVQRCDACARFDGDESAARAAADALVLGPDDVAWWPAPTGEDPDDPPSELPGDWAIRNVPSSAENESGATP